MDIGYIPSPRTAEGRAQPMHDDPADERRLNEMEAAWAAEHDLRDLEIDRWSWPEDAMPHRDQDIALMDEYGLRVACVGLWGKDYLHPEEAEEAEAELQRAIAYADRVDADVFVTGTEVPVEMDRETAWDEGVSFYGELIDRIADHGMETAFYFGHGESPLVEDRSEMRRFADALPDALFKVDPANLLAMGMDPKAVLDEFGDRVGHFHIKDGLIVEEDGDRNVVDQPPAGMGDVPWGNVVDLLYLGGYDGVLSIEPHGDYWGHRVADESRRQGIRIAQEHVAQFLKPTDRPDYLSR